MHETLSKDRSTLITYFAETEPTLLRPAQGILRHPSVSPTLPGECYGTAFQTYELNMATSFTNWSGTVKQLQLSLMNSTNGVLGLDHVMFYSP